MKYMSSVRTHKAEDVFSKLRMLGEIAEFIRVRCELEVYGTMDFATQ